MRLLSVCDDRSVVVEGMKAISNLCYDNRYNKNDFIHADGHEKFCDVFLGFGFDCRFWWILRKG